MDTGEGGWLGVDYDIHARVYIRPIAAAPAAGQPSSWAADAVNTAITTGLVPQNLQSAYTQATTRAEFAALAVTLYEKVTGNEIALDRSIPFVDTTDINAHKAYTIGVVTGMGEGRFAPDESLTREQAAAMLYRLAYAVGQPFPPSAPTFAFADNASISSWAAEAVGQMQASGIMGGVGDNRFAPQGSYTREQSIVTMLRLFDIVDIPNLEPRSRAASATIIHHSLPTTIILGEAEVTDEAGINFLTDIVNNATPTTARSNVNFNITIDLDNGYRIRFHLELQPEFASLEFYGGGVRTGFEIIYRPDGLNEFVRELLGIS
jgi:hypothetical protein